MAGGRDERVRELFFVPSMADPTDEGEVVLYNNDLVALLGGQIKSLTTGVEDSTDPTMAELLMDTWQSARCRAALLSIDDTV